MDNGEFLIVLEINENYKHIIQDASQAFNFNNNECTVFPVVYYYKENSNLKHKSIVFLADSTHHDTAAVHTVQKMLISHVKRSHRMEKIIYKVFQMISELYLKEEQRGTVFYVSQLKQF